MAQHTYYLANNSTEPLTLSWGFNWKNLKVSYLDELLGEIVTKKELVEGREFQLPDNRVVSVKLKGSMMPQLEVLLNNEPVNGSATDPEDGTLPGAQLSWSSDIDGLLGTGSSITRTLSGPPVPCNPETVGHLITLTGTDSDNHAVSVQTVVRVGTFC